MRSESENQLMGVDTELRQKSEKVCTRHTGRAMLESEENQRCIIVAGSRSNVERSNSLAAASADESLGTCSVQASSWKTLRPQSTATELVNCLLSVDVKATCTSDSVQRE
jgi:hypothetical protein